MKRVRESGKRRRTKKARDEIEGAHRAGRRGSENKREEYIKEGEGARKRERNT